MGLASVSESFTGAVLVGGASRRFGTDKATAVVGGRPMGGAALRALAMAGASEMMMVGGDDRGFSVRHVPDRYPGEGPLGGVRTAFAVAEHDIVFVLACDMPAIDAATVVHVIANLGIHAAAVARSDRLEPLCAAYRNSLCQRPFAAVFAAGGRSLLDALSGIDHVAVAIAEPGTLANVNRPSDHVALAPMSIPEITVDELATKVAAGATVFDVRESDEYAEAHVPGAVLIPLGTVPDNLAAFPSTGEVLVICRSGGRSMKACEYLAANGRNAINIEGGTMAWIMSGNTVSSGPAGS
jgi:molybdopterin-guanine dinucleotide biosynthesis protein A/rhodanese-related sulfurtransferase